MTPGTFTIPAAHPSLPGHFPGHPVVPGVVLLDEVLARRPGATLATAKFTAPVLPGMAVDVQFQDTPGGRTRFTCSVDGKPVLHGDLVPAP